MNTTELIKKGTTIHQKQDMIRKAMEDIQHQIEEHNSTLNDLLAQHSKWQIKLKETESELTELICQCDQLPAGQERKTIICLLLQQDKLVEM